MLHRGDDMKEFNLYLSNLEKWVEDVLQKLNLEDNHPLNQSIQSYREEIATVRNKNASVDELKNLELKGRKLFKQITGRRIPYGEHQLPPLPYPYDALEPYISKRIMELHHSKHHQSYVDGLNKAEQEIYIKKSSSEIKHWLREQAFNGSGHYLHSIFWKNMTPNSTKEPIKQIKKQIETDFGSWPNFKGTFTEAANSVEGVGWAILFYSPKANRLGIQTIEKHQLFSVSNTLPLLVLDVWEHAYYLQYQTEKGKYIDNWWNVVNWEDVNSRFINASVVG